MYDTQRNSSSLIEEIDDNATPEDESTLDELIERSGLTIAQLIELFQDKGELDSSSYTEAELLVATLSAGLMVIGNISIIDSLFWYFISQNTSHMLLYGISSMTAFIADDSIESTFTKYIHQSPHETKYSDDRMIYKVPSVYQKTAVTTVLLLAQTILFTLCHKDIAERDEESDLNKKLIDILSCLMPIISQQLHYHRFTIIKALPDSILSLADRWISSESVMSFFSSKKEDNNLPTLSEETPVKVKQL